MLWCAITVKFSWTASAQMLWQQMPCAFTVVNYGNHHHHTTTTTAHREHPGWEGRHGGINSKPAGNAVLSSSR